MASELLSSCGTWTLECAGSVVAACGLSFVAARGLFVAVFGLLSSCGAQASL